MTMASMSSSAAPCGRALASSRDICLVVLRRNEAASVRDCESRRIMCGAYSNQTPGLPCILVLHTKWTRQGPVCPASLRSWNAHPDAVKDDVCRPRDVVIHVGAVQAMGVALVLVKHAALAV